MTTLTAAYGCLPFVDLILKRRSFPDRKSEAGRKKGLFSDVNTRIAWSESKSKLDKKLFKIPPHKNHLGPT